MITRDLSPIPYSDGKISVAERAKAIMQYGSSWPADMKSQNVVERHLGRTLDNSHTLLRNIRISGADITVPLILISSQGITVLYNSPTKGIFRAQGNSWGSMNSRNGKFQAVKPNLIMRTLLITRAVETFLHEKGYNDLPLESALIMTDPGTHVDAPRPDVRVILMDGINRFANQLADGSAVMDRERRYKLVELFVQTAQKAMEPEIREPKESAINDFSQRIDSGFTETINPLKKHFNFSRQQWLVLGAIVIVEVLILVGFLMLILFTA